ncbi:hypothetical protein EJ07DRAFT_152580 [Lizonia empirigonia]|nr:hypothetical protein EJ07DRAFT_152580 [Lizonia empirigonia]
MEEDDYDWITEWHDVLVVELERVRQLNERARLQITTATEHLRRRFTKSLYEPSPDTEFFDCLTDICDSAFHESWYTLVRMVNQELARTDSTISFETKALMCMIQAVPAYVEPLVLAWCTHQSGFTFDMAAAAVIEYIDGGHRIDMENIRPSFLAAIEQVKSCISLPGSSVFQSPSDDLAGRRDDTPSLPIPIEEWVDGVAAALSPHGMSAPGSGRDANDHERSHSYSLARQDDDNRAASEDDTDSTERGTIVVYLGWDFAHDG